MADRRKRASFMGMRFGFAIQGCPGIAVNKGVAGARRSKLGVSTEQQGGEKAVATDRSGWYAQPTGCRWLVD